MGDRYWITGVQAGLLLVADYLTKEQRQELMAEIQEEQWLGDKKAVRKLLKHMEKQK